jgi:hypothetical protein
MRLFITEDMLNEVKHVLANAVREMQELRSGGADVADAAAAYSDLTDLEDSSYVNPFILGYARTAQRASVGWERYVESLTPARSLSPSMKDVAQVLGHWGITLCRSTEQRGSKDLVKQLTAAILDHRIRRRGMPTKYNEMLSANEARLLAHIVDLRASETSGYPVTWVLTSDRILPQVTRDLPAVFAHPVTYAPRRWGGYLDLVQPRGDMQRVLSASLLQLSASGFSHFVAKQMVLTLLKKRKEPTITRFRMPLRYRSRRCSEAACGSSCS